MTTIKTWARVDWGTWALPLYVTHLDYPVLRDQGMHRDHVLSIRVLCFGFFVEWGN